MKKTLILSWFLWQHLAMASGVLPFSLPWVNGPKSGAVYQSTDHPGAVFVLIATCNDVDTTSHACSYNEPYENQLAAKYAKEPRVQILDIDSGDTAAQMNYLISLNQVNHPFLFDADNTVLSSLLHLGFLEATFPPLTFVIAADGQTLVSTHLVWSEENWDKPGTTILQKIDAAIAAQLAGH